MSGDRSEIITLAHGAGGERMRELIEQRIAPRFRNEWLAPLSDSALLEPGEGRLAFTTDSYVIDPIFFPGGDIGYLSVCGTVNDLAVSGAVPLYLSAGLILEEGLELAVLDRVLDSMARAAAEAGVRIVTGDTKVVARGAADRIFINTAGIGRLRPGLVLGPQQCRPGDRVLVSGPLGSHGIAVLLARGEFGFEAELASDVAPLAGQVGALVEACPGVRMMRDATRGGLAGVLNEISAGAGLGIALEEQALPLLEAVRGACELLGFDPLFLANEGVFAAVVPPEGAERALAALRSAGATQAALIGTVVAAPRAVTLRTLIGGERLVVPLGGELLPRIC